MEFTDWIEKNWDRLVEEFVKEQPTIWEDFLEKKYEKEEGLK